MGDLIPLRRQYADRASGERAVGFSTREQPPATIAGLGPDAGTGHRAPPGRAAHRAPEPLWRRLVGDELRRRRLAQGRTLADVAARAGVSTQYLSEVERGRKEPSSEILAAVSAALGMTLLDLTGGVTSTLAAATGMSNRTGPAGPTCLAV